MVKISGRGMYDLLGNACFGEGEKQKRYFICIGEEKVKNEFVIVESLKRAPFGTD